MAGVDNKVSLVSTLPGELCTPRGILKGGALHRSRVDSQRASLNLSFSDLNERPRSPVMKPILYPANKVKTCNEINDCEMTDDAVYMSPIAENNSKASINLSFSDLKELPRSPEMKPVLVPANKVDTCKYINDRKMTDDALYLSPIAQNNSKVTVPSSLTGSFERRFSERTQIMVASCTKGRPAFYRTKSEEILKTSSDSVGLEEQSVKGEGLADGTSVVDDDVQGSGVPARFIQLFSERTIMMVEVTKSKLSLNSSVIKSPVSSLTSEVDH